jgi:hypothetical protein
MRRTLIIILTLITTVIHFYFFSTDPKGGLLFTMFLLNGLGYLGLLGLLYLPLGLPTSLHRLVRPVFIGYTVLTILLYIIISAQSGIWSVPWAPVAKVAEVILVWRLLAEGKVPAVTKQTA